MLASHAETRLQSWIHLPKITRGSLSGVKYDNSRNLFYYPTYQPPQTLEHDETSGQYQAAVWSVLLVDISV
jgi:hypothetical protein